MEEWMQGRHLSGEGRDQNREEQNIAIDCQRVKEAENGGQFQK